MRLLLDYLRKPLTFEELGLRYPDVTHHMALPGWELRGRDVVTAYSLLLSLLLGHVHDPPLLSWGWVPPPPFQLAVPRAVPYLFPVPSCPDCLHIEPWASGGQQCSLCSLKNHSGSLYPNLPLTLPPTPPLLCPSSRHQAPHSLPGWRLTGMSVSPPLWTQGFLSLDLSSPTIF